MTYQLLGTGVCLLKSALCVRRFHDRKKTGSDMISARNPTAAVALGFPLYTLVRSRNKRTCPASIRQRLFLGELPRESVLGTEHGGFDYVSSTDGIHQVAALTVLSFFWYWRSDVA